MIIKDWSTLEQKRDVRGIMFDQIMKDRKGKPLTSFLTLPGFDVNAHSGSHCVKQGLECGAITLSGTRILGAEYYRQLAPLIIDELGSMGFKHNPLIHVGDIASMKITQNLDSAFLDLTGSLNMKLCTWMRGSLAPMISIDGSIFVTVSYCPVKANYSDIMASAFVAFGSTYQNLNSVVAEEYQLRDDKHRMPFMVLKSALRNFDFSYRGGIHYQDSNFGMLLFRLGDFRPLKGTNGFPSLEDILSHQRKGKSPMSKKISKTEYKRRAAKAAATKRAKALFEKRSEAAKKAVATRKANALFAKRSEAAKKAVATRRRNAQKAS